MTKYVSILALAVLLIGCGAEVSNPVPPAETQKPATTVEVETTVEGEIAEDTEATGDVTFEAALEELDLLEQ